MMPRHHPSEATLVTYAAGSLGESLSLVVASHLTFCTDCRAAVASGEALGGNLLDELVPEALAVGAQERVLALLGTAPLPPPPPPRIIDPSLPAPLGRYLGHGLGSVPWRMLGPGLRHCDVLPAGNGRGGNLQLLRIAPGRRLPRHSHNGTELTLVLAGSYTDEVGQFGRGDLAEHDSDTTHEPVSDRPQDCICLIATEGPLIFENLIARMFQRITGL